MTRQHEPSSQGGAWRKLLLGILLSGLFLWLALRGLDWTTFWQDVRSAQWWAVLLAWTIWLGGMIVRAIRWRILMGDRPPFIPTFHILNIGFLINSTLPFRVGDLIRAYLVGHRATGVTALAALSTVVTERIIDMLSVVMILVAVLPILAVDPVVVAGGLTMGAAALASFIVLLIGAHRPARVHGLLRLVLRAAPVLARLSPERLLDHLLEGLRPLTQGRRLLRVVFWTAVSWMFSVAGAWMLALAFPDLPTTPTLYAAMALTVTTASFSLIIPFTIANVGPFEASIVFVLLSIGVSQNLAVAYAVVWHVTITVLYGLLGGLGLLALGLSTADLRQATAAKLDDLPTA